MIELRVYRQMSAVAIVMNDKVSRIVNRSGMNDKNW